MKRLGILAALAFPLFFSCKKFIQKQEENAVLKLMTSGFWKVTGFKQNDSDITTSFSGYLFKFDENNTVTGTIGSTSYKGQWSVDINARSITSDFPAGNDTIGKLNEVWKITDSYTDSVSAKSTDLINHINSTLQLKKQ